MVITYNIVIYVANCITTYGKSKYKYNNIDHN